MNDARQFESDHDILVDMWGKVHRLQEDIKEIKKNGLPQDKIHDIRLDQVEKNHKWLRNTFVGSVLTAIAAVAVKVLF